MFRSTDTATPPPDVDTAEPLVPLSVLSLDLPEPPIGWLAYLSSRDIAVVEDSIGRSAVASADARLLISEHRADEVRKAELRAESEKRAVEADQRFRAQLSGGVAIPAGMSYGEAAKAAELDAQSYRPRRTSLVEDLLSNDGITFHSIQHEADEGGS
jgi:hypothetical protein